jgi:Leucine-rich repeat (LRR) protein
LKELLKQKILDFNSLLNGTGTECEIEALTIELFGSDLNNVTGIDISGCNLTEYPKCIKYFKNLTDLYCDNNQLSNLDISNNVNLIYLDCENNQLSNIDISNNVNLTYLHCSNNQLTNIDISNNVNLTYLTCYNNPNFKYGGRYIFKSEVDELRKELLNEQRLEKLNNIFENL